MANRPTLLEARCTKCGETFNPADEYDMEHLVRVDGTECGGEGLLTMAYGIQLDLDDPEMR